MLGREQEKPGSVPARSAPGWGAAPAPLWHGGEEQGRILKEVSRFC